MNNVHESQIYNLLPRLGDRKKLDVFFQIQNTDDDAGCRELYNKYPTQTMEAALAKFNPVMVTYDTPKCEAWLNTSSCCRFYSSQQSNMNILRKENMWASWESYARKASCFDKAETYALEHNITYAWYVIYRPDMIFLEPLYFSLDTLPPTRVYALSKESNQPPGDYLYFIPRSWFQEWMVAVAHHDDHDCDAVHHPFWPPEFKLWDYLQVEGKGKHIPLQMIPLLFAFARCTGELSCQRLQSEVLYNARFSVSPQETVSPVALCYRLLGADPGGAGVFGVEMEYPLKKIINK